MDPQQLMAYSLLGILICNVLTLIAVAVAGMQVLRVTTEMKEQTQKALQNVQRQVGDTLQQVRPVIEHLQASARSVRVGVQSAQGAVQEVESNVSTVAAPVAALMVAGRLLGVRGTKFGIVGLVVGALLNARQRAAAKQAKKKKSPSAFLPLPNKGGVREPDAPMSVR